MLDATGSNLLFSTLLGGDASDVGHAIFVDAGGYIYVAGKTISVTGFPLVSELQAICGGCASPWVDAFVTMYAPAGGRLPVLDLPRGESEDTALDIAADPLGDIYVAGAYRLLAVSCVGGHRFRALLTLSEAG